MKNLSDLKRRLKIGVKIKKLNGLTEKGIGGVREVTKIQTNSFRMDSSWLDFPKATLLECNGNIFRVYMPKRKENTFNPEWDYKQKGELVGEYEILNEGQNG